MLTLARDFNFSLGQNADEYYRPQRHYKTFMKPAEPIEPKELAVAYLEERGISAATVKRFQITAKDDELIAFTHFDQDGNPQTIKYRNPHPKEDQAKEFFERNCKPILYGMWLCDPQIKTLIVTEGQIDALSVAEAGFQNVVSVPGGVNSFTWVPYCWDWMQQWEKIIVFGDHENGKVTLYADFLQRWKGKVWCVREDDYLDCKDANDIIRKYGKDQIRACIDNAAQPPIPKIIDLSEVEDVDVATLEKLHTGIWELDDVLHGGLPFGQLVIITGKSGDGKSTLANQLLINAVNEGYKSFAYSGELPNYLLKAWMMFQAAGPQNVVTVRAPVGMKPGEYEVEQSKKKLISEWFCGNVWIYDNRIADDEESEQIRLVELLESVIVQNGVRVILLDNLMTAMDLEPDGTSQDKYDRQSRFCKTLARMAIKHNVLIVMVAHKRKASGGETVNDNVSGSADIVNLASIVISYERIQIPDFEAMKDPKRRREQLTDFLIKYRAADLEEVKQKRILFVSKNRLTGDVTDDGILLEYDPATKRIFRTNGERKRRYNWDDAFLDPKAVTDQGVLPWK